MPINKDNVKKALDHFENDDFVASKEILSKEIQNRKNEFIKDKLGLQKDVGGSDKEE